MTTTTQELTADTIDGLVDAVGGTMEAAFNNVELAALAVSNRFVSDHGRAFRASFYGELPPTAAAYRQAHRAAQVDTTMAGTTGHFRLTTGTMPATAGDAVLAKYLADQLVQLRKLRRMRRS